MQTSTTSIIGIIILCKPYSNVFTHHTKLEGWDPLRVEWVNILISFLFGCIFKSLSHRAEGLLLMEILSVCLFSVCDNFEPCDWSDCPKACLSLVETGSNVSEEEQVLGSRGECYLQYKSTQTGFDRKNWFGP